MEKYVKELYHKMKEEKDFGPAEEILFTNLEFVLSCMNEAMEKVKSEGQQVNVTRDKDKDPYMRKNVWKNYYDENFDKMLRLLKALHLTREQKVKIKTEEKKNTNSLLALKNR